MLWKMFCGRAQSLYAVKRMLTLIWHVLPNFWTGLEFHITAVWIEVPECELHWGLTGSYKQWCWHGCLTQHIQLEPLLHIALSHRQCAGHCTKPGHIHLWIMHFVRGVVPFARVGRGVCHWGICLGLHLSTATDETPTLSISQLPVTSLPRNEWWYIGMISHERFQSCHIYSTLEGLSACSLAASVFGRRA